MKTIKGTYRDNNYFEYEVNGKSIGYKVNCIGIRNEIDLSTHT